MQADIDKFGRYFLGRDAAVHVVDAHGNASIGNDIEGAAVIPAGVAEFENEAQSLGQSRDEFRQSFGIEVPAGRQDKYSLDPIYF